MMEVRRYQQEALAAVDDYLRQESGHPIVVIPTGGGKSHIMAEIIRQYVGQWPDTKVMNAVHSQELVEQNRDKLAESYDGEIATYSAGLGAKELHANIVFAGIQSVFRAPNLGHYDLLFIDEAHRVSQSENSMYQQLIARLLDINPKLRVIGFTATPYRMGTGAIYGKNRLFENVAYEASIARLIEEGYLSKLVAIGGKRKIDTSKLEASKGGDYTQAELSLVAKDVSVTRAACDEIAHVGIQHGEPRKGWVIFCVNKAHAQMVQDYLGQDHGVRAEIITDETPKELRKEYLTQFKNQKLRCLINVNILTEGFDAPHVDLIAMLRPTKSVGLYYQMVGRGLRIAEGKTECLVLDFAGNVSEHGCIDNLVTPTARQKTKKGEAPARECPDCRTMMPVQQRDCACGFSWPVEEQQINHNGYSSDMPLLSSEVKPEWVKVDKVIYRHHKSKRSNKNSIMVSYHGGLRKYSEWVCVEHQGFPRVQAEKWWRKHGGGKPPYDVNAAIEEMKELNTPLYIKVVREKKHHNVVDHKFK